MTTWLGVDGGGSKTAFLLTDDDGVEIFRTSAGPSNWLSAGPKAAAKAICDGAARLPSSPKVVCGGFAGAGRREGLEFYQKVLKQAFPKSKVIVATDAFIAYVGAIGLKPGVLLIAGTGSIVIGRRRDGKMIRAGGWGPQFGDEGGGFWMGREAIRAALVQADLPKGAGNSNAFGRRLARRLRLPSIQDVVTAWSSGQIQVSDIAALFPELVSMYLTEPAESILRQAANHLRSLVELGCAKVGVANAPVSFSGSVAAHPLMQNLMGIPFHPPIAPPERGAILWAQQTERRPRISIVTAVYDPPVSGLKKGKPAVIDRRYKGKRPPNRLD